jgi:beta-galactosidase/beta-glucuronidase
MTAWMKQPVVQHVKVSSGNTSIYINTTAEASDIKLWWPANTGRDHPLYNISIVFSETGGSEVSASRAIGFRHVALVTGNDTDPAYIKKAATEEGSELGFGMYFRINGAALFTRGANMIPMEEFEGRMDADAHTLLVQSAHDANFNILRVWGGGIFLPDAWYDACDKNGIVVYHDMQYAQQGHAPAVTSEQDAELRHQIRRLSSHPSIIMWDGCNECRVIMDTGTAIYATFVLTVVAEEDKSRAIWPSCPALGWTTGVDRLTIRPNGNALTTPPNGQTIETHGPYQHGSGWPSVNGPQDLQLFDANIPIKISQATRDIGQPNVYASEFGSSVMSSFESMSPTLAPEHWSIHGGAPADTCNGGFSSICTGNNTMAQRNYACDNIIDVYFGKMDFSAVGEQPFKKQLYLCMLGQALLIKSNIETRRSKNELGIIVWQFNEIWPTGGWGSIEYGTPVEGQVIGGRWKPLHYLYRQSIYADVMATCGQGGQCYVSNDGIDPFKGTLNIQEINFVEDTQKQVISKQLDMVAGMAVTEFFSIDLGSFDATKSVLFAEVTSSTHDTVSQNVIAMSSPANWHIPKAVVTIKSITTDSSTGGATINLSTDKTALYVTLTTKAIGRFSENTFVMVPGKDKVIEFVPFVGQKVDQAVLKATTRVEHLGSYLAEEE